MRSSIRNWDSKISFFAFADVITSVCGMLIFITLLLATDLDKPSQTSGEDASAAREEQLREILRRQAEADARNARLQALLAGAETAPAPEQLQADISQLQSQLSAEQQKQAMLAGQLDNREASLLARDHILGLDELKAAIARVLLEADDIARQETKVRIEIAGIEQQKIPHAQALLAKARQREGQVWLIPGATAKEAILITVADSGVTIERFNHPELRKQFEKNGARPGFDAYVTQLNGEKQYLVFYVRPSGIGLFQALVNTARAKGFDVGTDALEEGRQLHFSTPPPLEAPDTPAPPRVPGSSPPAPGGNTAAAGSSGNAAPSGAPASPSAPAATNAPPPAAAAAPPAPPKKKSWWQRFLEWIGLG
jgi:hypothetical protein